MEPMKEQLRKLRLKPSLKIIHNKYGGIVTVDPNSSDVYVLLDSKGNIAFVCFRNYFERVLFPTQFAIVRREEVSIFDSDEEVSSFAESNKLKCQLSLDIVGVPVSLLVADDLSEFVHKE